MTSGVRYMPLPNDERAGNDANEASTSIQFESAVDLDFRSIHTYAPYNNIDYGFDRRVVDKVKRKMFGCVQ